MIEIYLLGGIVLAIKSCDWEMVNVKNPKHVFAIVVFAVMWIPIIFFIAMNEGYKRVRKGRKSK